MPQQSTPPHDQSIPTEVLDTLWRVYSGTLVDVHYQDAVVQHVWHAFRRMLEAQCPLRDSTECLTAPVVASGDVVQMPTAGGGVGGAGLAARDHSSVSEGRTIAATVVFELRWEALDEEQRKSLYEAPLTLIPMLEFLRACVAWQQQEQLQQDKQACYALLASGRVVDAVLTRVHLMVRATGAEAVVPFHMVGANTINHLMFVHGTIVRLSAPRMCCRVLPFRCALCGCVLKVDLEGGPVQYPPACQGKGCRGAFVPVLDDADLEEVQLLKLQEVVDDNHHVADSHSGTATTGGHRVLEVELRGMLMDSVSAGDSVSIAGIVSLRRADSRQAGSMRVLCLRAVSVTSSGGSTRSRNERNSLKSAYASATYDKVAQFYQMVRAPNWVQRLVASVCPGIVGMSDVKAALLLALVGGTPKPYARSNIHVLMVGDPGLGKSQLLRAVASVSPRSSMATANTSSSCGLTITISRDPQTGETTFEAGAVVHGDGGITCIDEIDKGTQEHKALLEVMEQGTISIAKAGTLFSVPVNTTIVAAGNPCQGKFDERKSISENINLSSALLSRFDIIFLLKDGASVMLDSFASASSSGVATDQSGDGSLGTVTSHVLALHRVAAEGGQTRGGTKSSVSTIPLDLLTEFIQFARETCRPVMTYAPAMLLKEAYITERKRFAQQTTELPITPRYLQSLIRVCEAKAKLELRTEITEADASFAITMLACGSKTQDQSVCPSSITLGGKAAQGGATKKRSQQEVAIAAVTQCMASNQREYLSHDEAVACCADSGCKNPNALLSQLNEFGLLLMSGGKYRLRKK